MSPLFALLAILASVAAIPVLLSWGVVKLTARERLANSQPGPPTPKASIVGVSFFVTYMTLDFVLTFLSVDGHIARGYNRPSPPLIPDSWLDSIDWLLNAIGYPIAAFATLITETSSAPQFASNLAIVNAANGILLSYCVALAYSWLRKRHPEHDQSVA